jgi:hypothetical protein
VGRKGEYEKMKINPQPDGEGGLTHSLGMGIRCKFGAEDEKILKKRPRSEFSVSGCTYMGYMIEPEDLTDEMREVVKRSIYHLMEEGRSYIEMEDGSIIIFYREGRIDVHRTFEEWIPQKVILPSPTEVINEMIKESLKYL